jgi:predicted ribosome quality control (RQC) complex YloA/Tae2 family protein
MSIFVKKQVKIMTTYSLTLNDKEPKGKALIALLKKMDDIVLKKTKDESPYNPEFVAKIKNAMENKEFKKIDADKIWESL